MSRLRGSVGTNPELLKEGTPFDFARRAQLNVAEYSGALLAMLLFIQYKSDNGAELSKVGKIGAMLSLVGSFAFAYGYHTQQGQRPPPLRPFGALSRYCGFALLCVQLYKFTKQ